MTQNPQSPLHVALILDGNGRWATRKGLPRVAGHREGAKTVRKIVESASDAGIQILTLYAFSADNWKRPGYEVSALMKLFGDYLRSETPRCLINGVRMSIIGRRDRLSKGLLRQINHAEADTAQQSRLHLRIALDYSARDMLVYAASELQKRNLEINRDSLTNFLSGQPNQAAPDVDLLIRTGGDQRLSDFLLWECAYAEMLFLDQMWPDFSPQDLQNAVRHFSGVDRRFGGLNTVPEQVFAG